MGEYDATTWQAIGITLTVVGLAASALAWRSRGAASGLRGVGWSLLPLAAALTGLLRVAFEVADSVGSWAVRLVFSPVVWTGVVVAGVSVVAFVVSGFLRRRSPRPSRAERRAAKAGGPAAPAVTSSGRAPATTTASGKGAADEDIDDIEAILKKHGIS
ncbi:MAG: hypothetical protein WBQ50_12570 [Nocardioides sp.]